MPFIDMQGNQAAPLPSTAGLVPGGQSPVVSPPTPAPQLAVSVSTATQAPTTATQVASGGELPALPGVKQVDGPGFPVEAKTEAPVDFEHKLADSLQQFAQIDQQVSTPPQPAVVPTEKQDNAIGTPVAEEGIRIGTESKELSALIATPAPQPPIGTGLPPLPVTPAEQAESSKLETAIPDASEITTPELAKKHYSLDDILEQAVKIDASDVHLNVGYRAIARKDGELVSLQSPILDNDSIKSMISAIVVQREGVDIEKVRDLDIAYHLPKLSVRFRVNIYREKDNYAAAFRLVPTKIRTLEELHMPALIKQFTTLEQGLILVTGATGSGKTTTIAALLNEINQTQNKHIVTVEDPIEYIYPIGTSIVSQRGMREDSASWADALKSILRQDPDVVLIGEMRDLETISSAMTIAETGHLVFATLHTNNAAQTVDRIIDVFPEHQQNQIRTQLANVLTAVVSQKLIPTNAGGGRRVATELLISTSAVQAAIREAKVHQIDNIIQTSAEIGMISMEKSLVNMVRQGLISPEQAQLYANKPNDIISLLK